MQTLLVAHLHFFPLHKPTLKNAKELPSQSTTTRQLKKQNEQKEKGTTANMGLAKVGLWYKAEHLYFLLAFVLNLNFSTF